MGGGGSKLSMWNMLHAIDNDEFYEVFLMLKAGVDPNLAHAGVTPLQIGIESGNADIVAMLLHWNANPLANTASRARGAGWRTGEPAKIMCERYIRENRPNSKKQIAAAHQVPDSLQFRSMQGLGAHHGLFWGPTDTALDREPGRAQGEGRGAESQGVRAKSIPNSIMQHRSSDTVTANSSVAYEKYITETDAPELDGVV